MKLKEFIEQNDVTAYEVVTGVAILSAVVGETSYGLNVDTSNIMSGTPVVRFTDFTLTNDQLTVDGLTIDTSVVDMLGM